MLTVFCNVVQSALSSCEYQQVHIQQRWLAGNLPAHGSARALRALWHHMLLASSCPARHCGTQDSPGWTLSVIIVASWP